MPRRGGYQPNTPSPPGDSIAERLEHEGLSAADLARARGCSQIEVEKLLSGDAPITVAWAFLLEEFVGLTATFWLRREANYRADLRRLALRNARSVETPDDHAEGNHQDVDE